MQCIRQLVEKGRDFRFVRGIDLLPVDNHSGGFRLAKMGEHILDKPVLAGRRSLRKAFDRFRLPGVADEIRQ